MTKAEQKKRGMGSHTGTEELQEWLAQAGLGRHSSGGWVGPKHQQKKIQGYLEEYWTHSCLVTDCQKHIPDTCVLALAVPGLGFVMPEAVFMPSAREKKSTK